MERADLFTISANSTRFSSVSCAFRAFFDRFMHISSRSEHFLWRLARRGRGKVLIGGLPGQSQPPPPPQEPLSEEMDEPLSLLHEYDGELS